VRIAAHSFAITALSSAAVLLARTDRINSRSFDDISCFFVLALSRIFLVFFVLQATLKRDAELFLLSEGSVFCEQRERLKSQTKTRDRARKTIIMTDGTCTQKEQNNAFFFSAHATPRKRLVILLLLVSPFPQVTRGVLSFSINGISSKLDSKFHKGADHLGHLVL